MLLNPTGEIYKPNCTINGTTNRKSRYSTVKAANHKPAPIDAAKAIAINIGKVKIRRFSDGETYVKFEESVRGADVYVIQPTCPPVDSHLMELLICIDALRRASAWRVTAVIPYYGYARQEKKDAPREPITAKLIADLIGASQTSQKCF